MRCPACGTAMRSGSEGGVPFAACSKCAGLWFDNESLGRLIASGLDLPRMVDALHRPAAGVESSPGLVCPTCQKGLQSYRYQYTSPITLDSCEGCGGVFVQDGDLEAIQEWRVAESKAGNLAVGLAWMEGNVAKAEDQRDRLTTAAKMLMAKRMFASFDTQEIFENDGRKQ